MVHFWWNLNIGKIGLEVSNPPPWIDAEDLDKYGVLLHEYLISLVPKAKSLQVNGWTLRLEFGSLNVKSEFVDYIEDARKHIAEADIDHKDITWLSYKTRDGNQHYDGEG